jgi:hypothetical protein
MDTVWSGSFGCQMAGRLDEQQKRCEKLVFRELGLSPKFTGKFSQPSKTAKFTQGEIG